MFCFALDSIKVSTGAVWCVLACALVVCGLLLGDYPAAALSDVPQPAFKIPPMVKEESVSTYIPSESVSGNGLNGLAVNVIYPAKPRYQDGAPIVIVVPGGDGPDGLNFTMHAAQVGFAEVRFAFPGGGGRDFRSSGIYDYRGMECQRALRDVLLFASGKTVDYRGRSIAKLVPKKLSLSNVGIVGWSNGGNIVLVTMARYAHELPFLSWVAFYESSIGSMFFPPNLGSVNDLLLNPHYRLGTAATGKCLVDYRKMAWQPNIKRNPGRHKKRGEPEVPGVLFFDENKNGKWDESTEFAMTYALDVGLDKQIYPSEITAALERLEIFVRWLPLKSQGQPSKKERKSSEARRGKEWSQVERGESEVTEGIEATERFHGLKEKQQSEALRGAMPRAACIRAEEARVPQPTERLQQDTKNSAPGKRKDTLVIRNRTYERVIDWPQSMATLKESEAYFRQRDGSLYISDVSRKYPNLLISIFGSELDHLQRQPDHPHIALQYNNWLENKVKWARLNPEPVYVGQLAGMNPRNFVNNEPNSAIDASAIDSFLEPEGLIPDYVFMEAQIAELADRKRFKKFNAPLDNVLVNYTSAAQAPLSPKKQDEKSQPKQDAASGRRKAK